MTNGDKKFLWNDGVDLKDLFSAQLSNIKELIEANDRNYNQRFESILQATQAALVASDRAVNKAEQASEKRFDAVNEFRSTLADQQRNLMPRAELEVMIKSMNDKIDALNVATIARQSEGVGKQQGMATVALVAGLVATIIGILIKFIK
jgi:hypothetical protein